MSLPQITPYELPQAGSWPKARAHWNIQASRAALLVHDMQEYFLRPFALDCAPMPEVLENLRHLIQLARTLKMPVVYSAQPGEQSRAERGLLWDLWGPGIISTPSLSGFPKDLKPVSSDVILQKKRYSAFHGTELQALLDERGATQLLIGGVYGHIGCLATATDAFMRGIQPFLLADAIADFSLLDHETALRQVARTCGVVADTRSASAQLISSSRVHLSETESPALL